ncbi:MAG: SprT family zinc-dependent metalloprotease [Candidatus Omnitrophota bacterium]
MEYPNEFLYLGNAYKLYLTDKQRPALCFDNRFLLDRNYRSNQKNEFLRWYKEQARLKIGERAELYSVIAGLKYKKINISNARTRWGSCSAKGRLNFSWRLIMAPIKVIDYVVVHELTHLTIMNHSKKFWQEVAIILPDYKSYRKWLRKNGHLLAV